MHHHDMNKFCDTECECTGSDSSSSDSGIDNPIADIEERINNQIDKALSDILSSVVERCISSSLKGCIEI